MFHSYISHLRRLQFKEMILYDKHVQSNLSMTQEKVIRYFRVSGIPLRNFVSRKEKLEIAKTLLIDELIQYTFFC